MFLFTKTTGPLFFLNSINVKLTNRGPGQGIIVQALLKVLLVVSANPFVCFMNIKSYLHRN
jgi:hypothetical protein